MNKHLLLVASLSLMFLGCNSHESDDLKNQNIVLTEENNNLKAQVEELESENKKLNNTLSEENNNLKARIEKLESENKKLTEELDKHHPQAEEHDERTYGYSGKWFADGMTINDVKHDIYPLC